MLQSRPQSLHRPPAWRPAFILAVFALLAVVLGARAVHLQLLEREFLVGQAHARHLRVAEIPAHRGMITDRFGEPLAISTPVDSVWAVPSQLLAADRGLAKLAALIDRDPAALRQELEGRLEREFWYLARHVPPQVADAVMALGLPGVALQREYHRFYPAGEVTGHLLGFTNIDDVGLEGVELAFDHWLDGDPGAKRVVRDRLGRTIETVELLDAAEPGRDLRLALDRRLQYIAYRALKATVIRHRAKGGSAVVLDARNGEILAMVNQPVFNPNSGEHRGTARSRNRAITDVFEPGSTLKAFTVAAALESGAYEPHTLIDTGPGYMRVSGNPVRDARDYGVIDVATVIQKSSNVGAAKIALSLEPGSIWDLLRRTGMGRLTGVGLPGEVSGHLWARPSHRPIERATLAFGYGVSVTALQLARAYTALARDGTVVPVSLLPRQADWLPGERVMSATTATAVRRMMVRVTEEGGTAPLAAVSGYSVAGKTGTVKKAIAGGYADHRYRAVFAGMAPAGDPRFVCVVMVDEPRSEDFYGGQVAAPVFSQIMAGALRLYNIAPERRRIGGPEHLMAAGDPAR
jgi:cell division protein FtsI (penicillin-binding protein 3)